MAEYFHFDQYDYQDAQVLLQDVDPELIPYAYDDWLGEFRTGLWNLYLAQYAHHARNPQADLSRHFKADEESMKKIRGYSHRPVMADVAEIGEYIHTIGEEVAPYIDRLWSAWFTTVTHVTPDEQTALSRLPYRDYLRTTYWRRVRAAMLVVANLRCQSDVCGGLDSWLYGESDLHIHHLHYKNKGREQLENLTVLCSECHRATHGLD